MKKSELSVEQQTKIRNEFEFRNVSDLKLIKETKLWVKGGRKLDTDGIPVLKQNLQKLLGQIKEQRKKRNENKKRGWINYFKNAV